MCFQWVMGVGECWNADAFAILKPLTAASRFTNRSRRFVTCGFRGIFRHDVVSSDCPRRGRSAHFRGPLLDGIDDATLIARRYGVNRAAVRREPPGFQRTCELLRT